MSFFNCWSLSRLPAGFSTYILTQSSACSQLSGYLRLINVITLHRKLFCICVHRFCAMVHKQHGPSQNIVRIVSSSLSSADHNPLVFFFLPFLRASALMLSSVPIIAKNSSRVIKLFSALLRYSNRVRGLPLSDIPHCSAKISAVGP